MSNYFLNFAMNMIRQNPNIVNNPNSQSMLNVIQSGDNEKGEQIARNLCNTYGISPEQAIMQAKQFFRLP